MEGTVLTCIINFCFGNHSQVTYCCFDINETMVRISLFLHQQKACWSSFPHLPDSLSSHQNINSPSEFKPLCGCLEKGALPKVYLNNHFPRNENRSIIGHWYLLSYWGTSLSPDWVQGLGLVMGAAMVENCPFSVDSELKRVSWTRPGVTRDQPHPANDIQPLTFLKSLWLLRKTNEDIRLTRSLC